MNRRILLRAAALATAIMGLGAQAQQWPSKPIKLVVPFTAGGSTDTVARIVAEKLTPRLGQPVIVENKAGAGGSLGSDLVAKSPPDGLTSTTTAGPGHADASARAEVVTPGAPLSPHSAMYISHRRQSVLEPTRRVPRRRTPSRAPPPLRAGGV